MRAAVERNEEYTAGGDEYEMLVSGGGAFGELVKCM